MRRWALVGLVAVGYVIPSQTSAQRAQDPVVMDVEMRSIAVEVGGDLGIGYWQRFSESSFWGVEVGASVNRLNGDEREENDSYFAFSPKVKSYLSSDASLRPYTIVGATASYGAWDAMRSATGRSFTYSTELLRAGLLVGAGFDWFPISQLSIGGHVGVTGGYQSRTESEEFTSPIGGTEPEEVDLTGWFVSTLSPGIRMHLYF